MKRLGFWLKWSARDLRDRWMQVAAIAAVLALGTGLYTGLGSMERWRVASNDRSFALLRAHDLKVSLAEGTSAAAGRLEQAARTTPSAALIADAQERLVTPTQVDASRPGRTTLVPGRLVGVPLERRREPIDGLSTVAGRALTAADSARPVAQVEAQFAELHDLPSSGRLRLAGGREVRYVGHARSPEYFLVTSQGGGEFGGAELNLAVVFAPLETAQAAAGLPGRVNDLVLRLVPGVDPAGVRLELERTLSARLPGAALTVTTLADEPGRRILYRDAEGDQRVFNVFALLLLGGAAFAAFNLASRIVEAQRRQIGIGMALGVQPRTLALRPLLTGAEIAVAGVVLGLGVGLLSAELLRGALVALMPLPVLSTPFEPDVFLRGAALGLALPILATAYPVWRGVRMRPIDAIRVGFRSAKGGGLAPAAQRVRLPGGSVAQMPLRNVLRTPRRTLMTLLGIAAVITIVVGLLGMIDSFLGTMDRAERETLGTSPSRMTVALDRFHPSAGPVVRSIRTSPVAGATEPRVRMATELRSGSSRIEASLELVDMGGALWRPTVVSGSLPPGGRGVLIAEEAARDLGVDVGGSIVVRHPRRLGGDAFDTVETRLQVAGLHPNPFRSFAYMDSSQAGALGLAGAANLVELLPAPGRSQDDVERALFGESGVVSVQAAAEPARVLRDRMDDFVGVLRVTELVALLLALLIAFNSTSINADERAREHATMFAFGVPVRRVLAVNVVESVLSGIAGTLLGVLFGMLVVSWIVTGISPETFPELGTVVSLSLGSIATAAAVGVVAVALAPLLTVRRMRRLDVSSTLRVVE